MNKVSLVIPGRNAEQFLEKCLVSAKKLIDAGMLSEIIYVDNLSQDRSLEIAKNVGALCLETNVPGPSAARNVGWKVASSEIIWFVDADCYVELSTLKNLVKLIDDVDIVSGGYLNANKTFLLPDLIQAEFEYRYYKMKGEVTYATTCNLLCRKKTLEELNGFNENILSVEDGDFVFRALEKNKKIIFNPDSRLYHFHTRNIFSYLKKQAIHGYWAAYIYPKYPKRIFGHSYTSATDHIQPFLVLSILIILPFSLLYSMLMFLIFCVANYSVFIFIASRISLQKALYFVILSFFRTIARLTGMLIKIVI